MKKISGIIMATVLFAGNSFSVAGDNGQSAEAGLRNGGELGLSSAMNKVEQYRWSPAKVSETFIPFSKEGMTKSKAAGADVRPLSITAMYNPTKGIRDVRTNSEGGLIVINYDSSSVSFYAPGGAELKTVSLRVPVISDNGMYVAGFAWRPNHTREGLRSVELYDSKGNRLWAANDFPQVEFMGIQEVSNFGYVNVGHEFVGHILFDSTGKMLDLSGLKGVIGDGTVVFSADGTHYAVLSREYDAEKRVSAVFHVLRLDGTEVFTKRWPHPMPDSRITIGKVYGGSDFLVSFGRSEAPLFYFNLSKRALYEMKGHSGKGHIEFGYLLPDNLLLVETNRRLYFFNTITANIVHEYETEQIRFTRPVIFDRHIIVPGFPTGDVVELFEFDLAGRYVARRKLAFVGDLKLPSVSHNGFILPTGNGTYSFEFKK